MTEGVKSHGAGIAIGDGASPETFTSLAEPVTIPALGGKGGLIVMGLLCIKKFISI